VIAAAPVGLSAAIERAGGAPEIATHAREVLVILKQSL
jgi:hypothetical protein